MGESRVFTFIGGKFDSYNILVTTEDQESGVVRLLLEKHEGSSHMAIYEIIKDSGAFLFIGNTYVAVDN